MSEYVINTRIVKTKRVDSLVFPRISVQFNANQFECIAFNSNRIYEP